QPRLERDLGAQDAVELADRLAHARAVQPDARRPLEARDRRPLRIEDRVVEALARLVELLARERREARARLGMDVLGQFAHCALMPAFLTSSAFAAISCWR